MIRVQRSLPEPPDLAAARSRELPRLRLLARVTGEDIDGYRVARDALYASQHGKCCYCEQKLEMKHRPVEHFRPKSLYWWLSWTWENLLFCCESCNESKSDQFPLQRGSNLVPEQAPPGREQPFLIDPAQEDPVEHIRFRSVMGRWLAFPRDGSRRGAAMIQVCRLNRGELVAMYNDAAHRLEGAVLQFRLLLEPQADPARIQAGWDLLAGRWLQPRAPFAALSADVIDHHIPAVLRVRYGLVLR